MSNKKGGNKTYKETRSMQCRTCPETVHNVDAEAVSVQCWKCATGMNPDRNNPYKKTKAENGSKD